MGICDPKGRDCIERNFAKSFNCSTTCVGIYADVQWKQWNQWIQNQNLQQETNMPFVDKDKYKKLILRYQKFKVENVRHFKFNSTSVLSAYGKLHCDPKLKF